MRFYGWIPCCATLLWLVTGCEAPREKVVAVYESGSPREAVLVEKSGHEVGARTWHGNGILATETEWKDGQPHGRFRRWGIDGVLYEEGKWAQGLKIGKWVSWYARGKRESEGKYVAGKREGRWEGLHPNGELAWERFFRNDSAIGLWKMHYANGQLQEESTCHISASQGFIRRWSMEGRLQFYQECRYGQPQGLWLDAYPGGAIRWVGRYEEGTPDSVWSLYRANGALWKTESWNNGVRHGLWLWLGRNADTVARADFSDGSGTFGEPCFNGVPADQVLCAETTWVHGKIQGQVRLLTENQRYWRVESWRNGMKLSSEDFRIDSAGHIGRLAAAGTWENGRRNGVWRSWYSNGQLKDSLHYLAGEFYGEQFHYTIDGHLYMKKSTRGRRYPVIVETLDPQPGLNHDL